MVVTSASDSVDIDQILYGLSIRGVRAYAIGNADKRLTGESMPDRPDRSLIVLESASELKRKIAFESVGAIWDAILEEYERAVTGEGRCAFCGYDVNRLPGPITCPECGVNLDSISARRALREHAP